MRNKGMRLECTGCGSTETIEQIQARVPTAISCCPERDMKPVLYSAALEAAANKLFDEFCPGIRKSEEDEVFYRERAKAVILTYIQALQNLGLKIVPREPTEAMVKAIGPATYPNRNVWEAMWDAAPPHSVPEKVPNTLTERISNGSGEDRCPSCKGSGVRTGTSWDETPNCYQCGGTGVAAKEQRT